MQMDGWTDMLKLIVTFHNFANVPKNIQPLMGAVLLDPWRGVQRGCPKMSVTTSLCYVTSQRSEDPIYTMAVS